MAFWTGVLRIGNKGNFFRIAKQNHPTPAPGQGAQHMKNTALLLLALLPGGPLVAQQVVCAAGQEHANGTRSITWTLGEPVNTTVDGASATLTQGFNQPWAMITSAVEESAEDNILVYPNPTRHELYVNNPAHRDGDHFQLLNAAGALVLDGNATERITTLDLEGYATGGYLLQLYSPEKKTLRTFKISVTR